MPTMKIEMTIPELQSFIDRNRVNIKKIEEDNCKANFCIKTFNKHKSDHNPEKEDVHFYFLNMWRRILTKNRRDLAQIVKLQIAAKKALRKAYEDQREVVMIDLVNEALRLNRERAEHQNEFVANIIVC